MSSDVGFNPCQLYVQSRNDHFLLINVNSYICNLTFNIACRFDLLDICINGPKEKLDSTVISQVLTPSTGFFIASNHLGNDLLQLQCREEQTAMV